MRQRSLVGQTMLMLQNLWQINLSTNASTLCLTRIGPGIGLMYGFSPSVSVSVLTGKIIGRLKLQVSCRAVPNVVHVHGPLCIRLVSTLTITLCPGRIPTFSHSAQTILLSIPSSIIGVTVPHMPQVQPSTWIRQEEACSRKVTRVTTPTTSSSRHRTAESPSG